MSETFEVLTSKAWKIPKFGARLLRKIGFWLQRIAVSHSIEALPIQESSSFVSANQTA